VSTAVLRAAFLAAGAGALRLDQIALSYSGVAQVLKVSGWHDDHTPFAQVTAPFVSDPVERAAQVAREVVASHRGLLHSESVVLMPAPTPITGLAATLREQLTAATARAAKIGEDAKKHVGNLNGVLDVAEGVVDEVKKAGAEIQAALGLSTNGGPPLDKPSAGSSE
jgi:hypothetical protein